MKRSFHFLNILQFLVAMNENIFKNLVAYFVIGLHRYEHPGFVLSLTGALFILPFILFSNVGGIFADKMSKQTITFATRFSDLTACTLGFASFLLESEFLSYVALFLLSTSSAIFGPSKYGIVPELCSKDKLVKANGFIASFTFLGIILGTTLASLFVQVFRSIFSLAILPSIAFAIITLILSCFIEKTPAMNPKKKWRFFVFEELKETYLEAKQSTSFFIGVFCFGYFLFVGGFVQLNIIPFAMKELGLRDIDGGYLFLTTSLGIGIGSYIISFFSSKNDHLATLSYSLIGMSIFLIFLGLFTHPLGITITWLAILGLLGGLFLVPSQILVMTKSREETRGRNFGSANFLSFVFALLAALALFILNTLLRLSPAESFVIIGIINSVIAFLIWKCHINSRRVSTK